MGRKIQILFIAPHLDGGGSERVLVNLLNHMDRERIVLKLLVFKRYGSLRNQIGKDIELVNIHAKRPRYSILEVSKLISENNFDVIFVMKHYLLLIVLIAMKMSRKNIPIVYREITHVSTELTKNFQGLSIQRLYNNKFLYKYLYKKVAKIIVPSLYMKSDLCSNFAVEDSKVFVINNPVDISLIKDMGGETVTHAWFNENIPIIISAGRLVKQKNFENLIRAFKIVLEKNYNARLIILGKGEKELELEKLITELKMVDNVKLLGHKSNPFKYIAKSDIFVLSSLWEGFPNILLEAMACETAVISTDCPTGPKEIIDNHVDGILVVSDDPEQLSDAIIKLLHDEKLCEQMSLLGERKVLDRFTIESIVPKYMDVLLNVSKSS